MKKAIVLVKVKTGKELDLYSQTRGQFKGVYVVTGAYDLIYEIEYETKRDLYMELMALSKVGKDYIQKTETLLVVAKAHVNFSIRKLYPGFPIIPKKNRKKPSGKRIAYVLINCLPGYQGKIIQELWKIKSVDYAYVVYGQFDIICKILGDSEAEEGKIVINQIRTIPEVKSTATLKYANDKVIQEIIRERKKSN